MGKYVGYFPSNVIVRSFWDTNMKKILQISGEAKCQNVWLQVQHAQIWKKNIAQISFTQFFVCTFLAQNDIVWKKNFRKKWDQLWWWALKLCSIHFLPHPMEFGTKVDATCSLFSTMSKTRLVILQCHLLLFTLGKRDIVSNFQIPSNLKVKFVRWRVNWIVYFHITYRIRLNATPLLVLNRAPCTSLKSHVFGGFLE